MPNESDDPDLFRTAWAIRDTLATRVHAEMFLDLVAEMLGESAWIETHDGGTRRLLFRRESSGAAWLIPWPLVSLGTVGRPPAIPIEAMFEGEPIEPPPRPGRAPKLHGLGPGDVTIQVGPRSVTIAYGDDGRWMEVQLGGPKETLDGAIEALGKKSAQAVELLAEFVAGLDIGEQGPGRVLVPVPPAGGVHAVWGTGLGAIREALFAGRVPRTATWVAADGYSGNAVAWGSTREEALSAWRAEVERVRPSPPRQGAPPGFPAQDPADVWSDPGAGESGAMVPTGGRTSDIPTPEPTPANTPAALIPLAAFPDRAPAIGIWTRLIGGHGHTYPAALCCDEHGFTMLGDAALAVVDLHKLDAQLDEADIHQGAWTTPGYELQPGFLAPPKPDCLVRIYRVVDEDTGMAIQPRDVSSHYSVGFHARMLDGDRLRGSAVRQRWIRE